MKLFTVLFTTTNIRWSLFATMAKFNNHLPLAQRRPLRTHLRPPIWMSKDVIVTALMEADIVSKVW